jgi:hypothetical protein
LLILLLLLLGLVLLQHKWPDTGLDACVVSAQKQQPTGAGAVCCCSCC